MVTTTEKLDENCNVIERVVEVKKTEPRPWFVANGTGYVKVGVTVNGIEYADPYPIMDHANRPIPAEKITTTDANKSKMRALAKGIAFHGLGLYIYEGEDLPESTKAKVKDLTASREKAANAANKAIKDGRTTKEEIVAMVEKLNDGNGNPRALPSIALCQQFIDEIAALKPKK